MKIYLQLGIICFLSLLCSTICEEKKPWEFNPNVGRDENGNVRTDVNIKRNGENHDIEAGWSKVVRGPNKAKPTWHVGGTVRWRRSADEDDSSEVVEDSRVKRSPEEKKPWELNPNVGRDENGNVRTDVNIKKNGENHDIEAGWSKVVRGPNKAKPTWHVGGTIRWRRSADEDDSSEAVVEDSRVKRSPEEKKPWELNPNVGRDENGNVRTDVNIKKNGENHDIEAGWSKVVRGPNKAKPTWHVGGTYRWRRSADEDDSSEEVVEDSRVKRSPEEKKPWELNPNVGRDENGNVRTDVNIKKNGENHDIEAGWSKVVRGPNKAKPTWHVGGTYRWRRSADEDDSSEEVVEDSRVKRSPEEKKPWELNPNVGRDENGNVRTDVNIKKNGENHDIEAGWSKVVRGPNKAKPTWHVGGTVRWRRSADEDDSSEVVEDSRVKRSPEEKKPWELNPNVGRDENGNVRTDVNIKKNGENHDIEAGWSKVVRGPNKAKPTWHVGGTYRWRRSADEDDSSEEVVEDSRVKRSPEEKKPWELNPNVGRDENGNVRTDVNIKKNGENHDIEAGWSKVVRGPNKAKPTWHVGGTYRWRRSADEDDSSEEVVEDSRVKRSPEEKKPWELNPNVGRDENGNVRTDVNIKKNGENHDIEAGWSKVVRGPNKAKPTWHVGGTIRWRRSADEDDSSEAVVEDSRVKRSPEEKKPWELNPNVGRDENGNVRTDVNIKKNGENHDIEAGWSKVVRGPNKAKPTWHVGGTIRWRRSADKDDSFEEVVEDSRVKRSPEEKKPWELNPNVGRDENGNVRTDVNIKKNGENHDIEAGWSKVVRGPNKAKPTWHVGGTIRWRRSADKDDSSEEVVEDSRVKRSPEEKKPWELNPNVGRDENGNVRTDVNIKKNGENHDIEAGWSKVVRGPNKAKPTWHVGGTYRWRRSADEDDSSEEVVEDSRVKRSPEEKKPWELNPNVGRDENGNVRTDVNIKKNGENHDIEAGWSKVVRGPNKAKPTWHVGGTIRWRRSADEDDSSEAVVEDSRVKRSPEEKKPWELNPNVGRDENGNVRTDVNIKKNGENHDIEAGWSKVVRGPNKAKPTWHVGGTIRWRRSADEDDSSEAVVEDSRVKRSPEEKKPWELNPNVGRDENGNVRTDVNIKKNGENHDIEAGWSKVVRGPNKAKPTWHVGGTIRWRRSADEDDSSEAVEDSRVKRSPKQQEPWELNPNVGRDENGNVKTDINIKRKGESHDFDAGWSKIVRGPNKAKPTWHVGGTFRW